MIHIVIPVFNEEESIHDLISDVIKTSGDFNEKFNIIVVNDCSYDNTLNILEKFKSFQNFKIINHNLNKGLGDAERTGFEYAAEISKDEDFIVRIEGDNSHSPKYIKDIINMLKSGYDVVNTSRFINGGNQFGLSNKKKVISYCANIFMKIILRIPNVRDFSCGYRGYKAIVMRDALVIFGKNFLQLRGLGFTSTLEIIIKLKMLGCQFQEVPFDLRYDKKLSTSKMVGSITSFGYLVMALLYHWPFGGWRVGYKEVRKKYKSNRNYILKKYKQPGYEKFLTINDK